MMVPALPFDVAANRIGQGDGRRFAGQNGVNGVAKLVGRLFAGIARIVVHAAGVAQFSLGIKDVIVGRAEGAVFEGNFLRFVA